MTRPITYRFTNFICEVFSFSFAEHLRVFRIILRMSYQRSLTGTYGAAAFPRACALFCHPGLRAGVQLQRSRRAQPGRTGATAPGRRTAALDPGSEAGVTVEAISHESQSDAVGIIPVAPIWDSCLLPVMPGTSPRLSGLDFADRAHALQFRETGAAARDQRAGMTSSAMRRTLSAACCSVRPLPALVSTMTPSMSSVSRQRPSVSTSWAAEPTAT